MSRKTVHSFIIIYPADQAAADRAEADRLRVEAEAQQAAYDAAMIVAAREEWLESRRQYYEERGIEPPPLAKS